jgi:hypothetical protein
MLFQKQLKKKKCSGGRTLKHPPGTGEKKGKVPKAIKPYTISTQDTLSLSFSISLSLSLNLSLSLSLSPHHFFKKMFSQYWI